MSTTSKLGLVYLKGGQLQPDVTINEDLNMLDALASGFVQFGYKALTTSGLYFGYYGGTVYSNGAPISIADGILALAASATNYVQRTAAGIVSSNTTGYTTGLIPMATVVTSSSGITSITDTRPASFDLRGAQSVAVAGSPLTLTDAQVNCRILRFTGTLTANVVVTLPAYQQEWVMSNETAGAFTLQVQTAAGSPITLTQGASSIVYGNGSTLKSSESRLLQESDLFGDFITSGIIGAPVAGLTLTLPAGVAYILGQRTTPAAFTHTYAASTDNYIDLKPDGTYNVASVANGGAAPALTTGAVRTQIVVTNATDVTGVTQILSSTPSFSSPISAPNAVNTNEVVNLEQLNSAVAPSALLASIKTVDGAGSGLDADLLDAQSGAYYLSRANHTGTQLLATISDAGTAAAANTGTDQTEVPTNADIFDYYQLAYKPSIQPTISSDFAKNEHKALGQYGLDDKLITDNLTFTRTSTAQRFNALGNYESVAADTARIDYEPLTGGCKGILVEPQRTNILPYSEDYTKWSVVRSTISFDSAAGMAKLSGTADIGTHYSDHFTSITSGVTQYISSVDVKKGNVDTISVHAYCTGGTTLVTTAYFTFSTKTLSNTSCSFIELPNGVVRIYIPITSNTGNTTVINRVYVNDGAQVDTTGLYTYLYRRQVEIGSYGTSYIPTNGSQVTRTADNASIPIGTGYNPSEGTVYCEVDAQSGETVLTLGTTTIVADFTGLKKYAVTYSADTGSTTMTLGNGTFKDMRYYPRALSSTELTELTK